MKFLNQTVIVTGGTRGIGRGIVHAFLKEGARVIATYNRNDQAAEVFQMEMSEYGENLILRKFDVSNPREVSTFFDYLDNNFPSIEVLINNSGIRKDNMVAMMPEEDFQKVMEVNLLGGFYMAKRAVISFMKNRFGRIINISSVGADLALAGQSNYAASKAAQVAFAKSLSKEVAKKGITVNNVCPGFIDTELISDLPPEQIKEYKKLVPMKRFGKIEEVASAVLFLAGKESSYITGASLSISGGL